MSTRKITNEMIQEVYKLLASISTPEDMEILFADLCTNKEVEQMAQRIAAAKLLINGKTYNQVIEKTDISSATLSRVSRCVQYGEGYKKFIK
ncbi:MAG: TrpR-related protein YerC/YecD [Clostridia bacterium]|nr:TrpR-related protein YerC/YecD [Clostridia bacterium]